MGANDDTLFDGLVTHDEWQTIQTMLCHAVAVEVHTVDEDGNHLCQHVGDCVFEALLKKLPVVQAAEAAGERFEILQEDEHGTRVYRCRLSGLLGFDLPIMNRGCKLATVRTIGRMAQPLTDEAAERLAVGSDVETGELLNASRRPFPGRPDMLFVAGQLCNSFMRLLEREHHGRQDAERIARHVATLAKVGRAVSATIDLGRVIDELMDAVPEVVEADGCMIGLVDDDGKMRSRAHRGVGDSYALLEFESGVGLAGQVLATGQPVSVPDLANDPRSVFRNERGDGLAKAMLVVPLRDGDTVIGALWAFRHEPLEYSGSEEQFLASLAEYASAAVRNAQLYERMGRAHRELGRATRRLHEIQEQLLHSDRLAEAGRLAGGAAHEMRNTLGGIIGAAATVRDHLDQLSEGDVRDLVAAIADEGWRLRDTLEDVRGFAKPRHYGTGTHSLTQVIEETARLFRYDPTYAKLRVATNCPDDIEFMGDRDRLKQVLLNLVRNAGDAVSSVSDRASEIRIEGDLVDRQAIVRVIDNGSGIDPLLLDRIWEPFFSTKGQAGTGLGLDVVRQIIEAQRGTITVESQLGVGSTFTVSLPGGRRPVADSSASEGAS